jgi:WD40 repeat protein
MLAAKRTFEGEDVSDTLANVLKGEPDWTALPANAPAKLRALLRHCLEKNRKQRLHDIGDARIEIDELLAAPAGSESLPVWRPQSRWRERAAWSVAAVALVSLAATLAARYVRTPAAAPEMRVEITTPETTTISFAISPDGRRLVFVASSDGQSRLWLRPIDTVSAQPLIGTEGASYPFWSPDSQSVGFFAEGKLKRTDIAGGSPQTLADSGARGGTWGPDGVILFAGTTASPLFRVSAAGGEVVPVGKLGAGQVGHRFPSFLPGSRQFLFFVAGSSETAGIYLGSLDSSENRRLTAADVSGVYLPPGWLLRSSGNPCGAARLDSCAWGNSPASR